MCGAITETTTSFTAAGLPQWAGDNILGRAVQKLNVDVRRFSVICGEMRSLAELGEKDCIRWQKPDKSLPNVR